MTKSILCRKSESVQKTIDKLDDEFTNRELLELLCYKVLSNKYEIVKNNLNAEWIDVLFDYINFENVFISETGFA